MDTGLQCLVALAGIHQLPDDAAQIPHQFAILRSNTEILRTAKTLTFKAKLFAFSLTKLIGSSLSAITKTGDYITRARIASRYGIGLTVPLIDDISHGLF